MNKYVRLFFKEISRSIRFSYKQYVIATVCLIGCVIYEMNGIGADDEQNIIDIVTLLFWGNDDQQFRVTDSIIRLPANWIFILAIYYFSVSIFIAKDKKVMLRNICVKMKNCYIWWKLKFAWLFFYTCAYFLVLILVIYLSSVIKYRTDNVAFGNNQDITIWGCIMVPFVCFSLACGLMLIQTMTNVVIGLGAVLAYVLVTAYIKSPFILGNFLMFCRTDLYMVESKIHMYLGLIMALLLCVAAYVGGMIYMNKIEYIREE